MIADDPQDDGWETVTDPTEIQKVLGKNGANKVLGLTAGGPGSGGGKAASEGERKAAFLATRVAGNIATLNSIGKDDQRPGVLQSLVRGSLGDAAANYVTGEGRQRAEAAQADLLDAALTLGTGAAYTKEQLDGYRKSYFPQLGDSEATVADKRERLKLLLESAKVGAGSAAPQIDAALKAAGYPVEQAKGGDLNSGAAGAVADGSGTPPASPPDNGDRTVGGFADELPAQTANQVKLTDQQRSAFAALARRGGSAEELGSLLQTFGVNAANPADLAKLADALKKNPNLEFGVADPSAELKPVNAGDGSAGAFARGVGNAGTLGFLDEIGAVVDGFSGGTYAQNLDRRRGQELYDEQNSGLARFGGQLLGGLPIGGVEFGGARQAARAAGVAAMRQGLGREVALMQANRAFAMRSALEGAGIGAVYGAGESDGGLGDRAVGAASGAAFGGATAGALSYGGGAILNRRAAAARAAGVAEPSEAAQIAQSAQEQGITLLPQDIAEGPGIGRATAGAAQTTFGANTVRERAQQSYDSFRNRVTELAGGGRQSLADVGEPIREASARQAGRNAQRAERDSQIVQDQLGDAPDITGAGQLIQRGATKWLRDTQETATKLYERVDISNDAPADLTNTRSALEYLTQGFESNKALSKLWAENPRLKATLEALTPEKGEPTPMNPQGEAIGGELAWGDLKRFRSIIGEIVGQPGLQADGNQIAALRKLYGAVSEDMRQTAKQAGGKAYDQFNRANSYFSARANRVRNTVSRILGDDNNATAGEAYGAVETALKDSAAGDPGFARRVLAQIPERDANAVRAAIVNRARGGETFDPKKLASAWSGISERGKSALLPQTGLRSIMDDAADRAAAAAHDPFEGKSAEQVYLALERAAESRGDSAGLARKIASLSPDEAQAVRTLFVNRLGMATAGAQDASGEAFSVARFLTRWNTMTPEARTVLFGTGEMRDNLTAVAKLAERVKASERLAGHSNTGAVNSFNATTGGLATAAIAFLTGHPIVGATLAAPAAYQRISAEVLTSPRLLNWLARAPKKPNLQAQKAHVNALSSIARAEPAIAQDVLGLQTRLRDALGTAPARVTADERADHRAPVDRQNRQQNGPTQGLQP